MVKHKNRCEGWCYGLVTLCVALLRSCVTTYYVVIVSSMFFITPYCAPWIGWFKCYSFHPYPLNINETMDGENTCTIHLLVMEAELIPMLDWCMSECMATTTTTTTNQPTPIMVSKELTRQNCNTNHISYIVGYVKVRKALYVHEFLFKSITLLTILVLGQFYLDMKVLTWYIETWMVLVSLLVFFPK